MQLKEKTEYVDLNPDFKPLPKYGHLSTIAPEFEAIKSTVDEALAEIWSAEDVKGLRLRRGNSDAIIPPGGPDRAKEVISEFIRIPARDGHQIELKLYKSPTVQKDATLLLYMHGGGWVMGNHETNGAENVHAASHRNIVVLSVDYRLAPEWKFPHAIHDCYDALLWAKENASKLGIDPEKIIVGGTSAGGNLAAALALEARDNGITGIVGQILNFPAVCHPKFFPAEKYEYGSVIQNAHASILDIFRVEFFVNQYIPNPEPDHKHSPLLAASHKNLPPALINCGGLDPLRDEAFAYAEVLRESGVDVEIHSYQGLPHVFTGVAINLPQVTQFYEIFNNFLSKHAGAPPAS
ncbi:Esterase LipI [Cladobotryum mycophilum]|uniref:Esterase LipI n=1 Tax=Cladobotryum mycophilum TaxID=491253 RepID=A0ABR0SHG5_9HYPO